jgi:uncharacterized membrane protein
VTLQPILDAPWLVKVHLLGAASALALAPVQVVLPEGVASRRTLGRTRATLVAVTAGTALMLHPRAGAAPDHGALSPAHMLLVVGGIALPFGIWAARTRRARLHRGVMLAVYAGAVLTAGLFAGMPAKVLTQSLSGSPPTLPTR